tara:strand:+ start:330 stop:1595 length:1266 start_codon:yes stop_codon:yes gene_type:complete
LSKIRTVKGTHDILEEDSYYLNTVISKATNLCRFLNYKEIQTPILEFSDLFSKTLGLSSDVVSKEMFAFMDQGGEHLTLRPEGTAPIARALVNNSLHEKQNQKFFYHGPMFRREKPQAGRLRQFNQFGVEYFNQSSFFCDLEVIFLANKLLNKLDILEYVNLEINTIGNFSSRQRFQEKLVQYLSPYKNELSDQSKKRLIKNPLRILDSKDEIDKKILSQAPKIRDFLDKESLIFYESLKESLVKLKVSFTENSKLVRGLDYYTHSVFEFISKEAKAQNTVLAGGRYDGLVKTICGKDICGVGWALGIERIILMVKKKFSLKEKNIISIFSTSDNLNHTILKIISNLQDLKFISFNVIYGGNLKKKFIKANKMNSSGCIILGEDEYKRNELVYKNFKTGIQSTLKEEFMKEFLQKEFSKNE